ncbi:MAG: hypothetical protein J0M36_05155 [Caulobacterales bacterium]|nr:hypothetical protein [Caulobacterales bacterium]
MIKATIKFNSEEFAHDCYAFEGSEIPIIIGDHKEKDNELEIEYTKIMLHSGYSIRKISGELLGNQYFLSNIKPDEEFGRPFSSVLYVPVGETFGSVGRVDVVLLP